MERQLVLRTPVPMHVFSRLCINLQHSHSEYEDIILALRYSHGLARSRRLSAQHILSTWETPTKGHERRRLAKPQHGAAE
jgi:hypothetical protein